MLFVKNHIAYLYGLSNSFSNSFIDFYSCVFVSSSDIRRYDGGEEQSKKCLAEYENDDDVNPELLWEMIKLKVCEQSLNYATDKKAKLNRK